MRLDLYAALRRTTRTSKSGATSAKVTLSFRAPERIFDTDDKPLGKALAEGFRRQLEENLLRGISPTGAPMPPISSATEERREREAAKAARGGEADSRYRDPKFRARVKRNFDRNYTAARLGSFKPQTGGPRGVLSGMLARSFACVPNSDGTGFNVFVAAKRGKPRPGEKLSALEVVFRDVPLWNANASSQPHIKAAMKAAADRLLGRSSAAFLRELTKAAQNVRRLADEVGGDE